MAYIGRRGGTMSDKVEYAVIGLLALVLVALAACWFLSAGVH